MLFEVYRNDGQCMMSTEQESCIPPIEIIKDIKAAGYKVLLDGKNYKISDAKKSKSNKENK